MKSIAFFYTARFGYFFGFCRKGQDINKTISENSDSFLAPFDSAYTVAKAFNPIIF